MKKAGGVAQWEKKDLPSTLKAVSSFPSTNKRSKSSFEKLR